MQDYVVITDSTTDLSCNMAKDLNIEVLPLHFNIKGKVYGDYSDGRDIKIEDFYNKLRSGEISVTSQININDFINAFKPHLENEKDILYISFSSGLSGTYSSAVAAKESLKEIYPKRKIVVVDSLCASLGEGMLVYLAAQEKRKGIDIESLSEWINNKKLNICHWFTVDDLNHLYRGGRVSKTSAFLGSMLKIKPILHVDDEGKLVLVEKSRGRKNSINNLIEHMEATGINLSNQTIFISHGDCSEEARKMSDMIKEKFKVKNTIINTIGPVIGTHSGPGTLALFFEGSKR